jgi:putative membrane protein
MKRSFFVLAAALLCLPAFAVDSESSTANVSAEQAFVTKAAQAGLLEVEAGKIALKRSSNQAVKDFAAQMVKDHEKASAELKTLATARKLNVPTAPDREGATLLHRLSAKPASEFDAEYGKQMIEGHEQAVTLFSDAAALRDKELAAWAKKTLPTLEKHKSLTTTLPAKPAVSPDGTSSPADPAVALPRDTTDGTTP